MRARAGFASSRNQSRQWVRHGHVTVNGKRVTIPSYTLKKGQVVSLRDKARKMIVSFQRHDFSVAMKFYVWRLFDAPD